MSRARSALVYGCVAAGAMAMLAGCAAGEPEATARRTPAAEDPPPSEALSPLLSMALPGVAGKTFTSAIVAFPPGARARPHRHGQAFVYAYVLEGSVVSQLEGSPAHTYHRGENWVEQPGAHHLVTANTSQTEPAKLLVVFVSNTGDELKVDDPSS